MILTIEVTQTDIDNGLKGDCSHCPVALAVLRANKDVRDVEVQPGYETIQYRNSYGDLYFASISSDLLSWIVMFDCDKEVHPSSFKLEFEKADLIPI